MVKLPRLGGAGDGTSDRRLREAAIGMAVRLIARPLGNDRELKLVHEVE